MTDPTDAFDEEGNGLEAGADDQGSGGDGSPAPWGEDFNPERAWNTITHLRGFEPDAKAYKRLSSGEDQETFLRLAEKYGYELAEDEEEEVFEDEDDFQQDDPTARELAELRKQQQDFQQWREQQETRSRVQAFHNQIEGLAKAKDYDLTDFERKAIFSLSVDAGLESKAVEAAFNELLGYNAEREKTRKARRPAPRTPGSGKTSTDVPKWGEMSDEEQARVMAERLSQR